MLLLTYCEFGSLLHVLKTLAENQVHTDETTRYRWMIDIARGMAHLSARKFIHRDLAARNVLVHSDDSAKVADFGLSRGAKAVGGEDGENEGESDYYRSHNGVFPVRWTAPESMETMRFTRASDVWSFGIVMYEICTDGTKPYSALKNNQDVIVQVKSGYRMPKPELCADVLYNDVMLGCWSASAADRPTFSKITSLLEEIVDERIRASFADQSIIGELPLEGANKRGGGGRFDPLSGVSTRRGSFTDFGDGDSYGDSYANPLYDGGSRRASDAELRRSSGALPFPSSRRASPALDESQNVLMRRSSDSSDDASDGGEYLTVSNIETLERGGGCGVRSTSMVSMTSMASVSSSIIESANAHPKLPPTHGTSMGGAAEQTEMRSMSSSTRGSTTSSMSELPRTMPLPPPGGCAVERTSRTPRGTPWGSLSSQHAHTLSGLGVNSGLGIFNDHVYEYNQPGNAYTRPVSLPVPDIGSRRFSAEPAYIEPNPSSQGTRYTGSPEPLSTDVEVDEDLFS
jgi:serine/threonine protein kinase